MAEFIKAHCARSGMYYGMRVEERDGCMAVTDFYDIEPDKAKGLGSTVDVPGLCSADNLLECLECGGRRIGGCGCEASMADCEGKPEYSAQCMYCKNLHVFAVEEGSEADESFCAGETVRLAQGQEVALCASGSGAPEEIRVGVGWDIAQQGANMDVDSSVIISCGCAAKAVSRELVYFGHMEHSSGCVVHLGDNLVGGKYKDNPDVTDSENIDVCLRKVPDSRDTLYFVLNIYHCIEREQTLESVRNLYIRLSDSQKGRVLVEYKMQDGFKDCTGIIIGKAYRSGERWMFKAIGKGVNVKNVHELYAYCE